MEYLECDRCGKCYSDPESVALSKREAETWKRLCQQDGDEARGLVGCPNITCPGELLLKVGRVRPDSIRGVLDRYPRLTAHLICASLGYFTPEAAARAILNYLRGEPNFCEWYAHMAQGFDHQKVLEVGRRALESAVRGRHHHYGYMAHYPQARALVEQVRRGEPGPVFASWF